MAFRLVTFHILIVLTMVVVWVAHIVGGAQQPRLPFAADVGVESKRVMLPQQAKVKSWPQWLSDRVNQAGVDLPVDSEIGERRHELATVHLLGLASITHRGAIFGDGSCPREAQALLHAYYQPHDACLVKVVDAAELASPIVLGPVDGTRKAALSHMLMRPLLPPGVGGAAVVGSHGSIDGVLRAWGAPAVGHLLAHVVVRPFGELIVKSRFSWTLIVGRCRLIEELFPNEDVPPRSWLEDVDVMHYMPTAVPLDPARFDEIAESLKRLNSGQNIGEAQMTDMIKYCEGVAGTLRGTVVPSERGKAEQEIEQAFMTMRLKSTHDVGSVSASAFRMMFPGSSEPPPENRSRRYVDVNQFRLDLSFMFVMRDLNYRNCIVKFATADSSPQHPFDWLLWKFKWIKAVDLLRAANAMKTLITTAGGALQPKADGDETRLSDHTARIAANKTLVEVVKEHLYVALGKRCRVRWARTSRCFEVRRRDATFGIS